MKDYIWSICRAYDKGDELQIKGRYIINAMSDGLFIGDRE